MQTAAVGVVTIRKVFFFGGGDAFSFPAPRGPSPLPGAILERSRSERAHAMFRHRYERKNGLIERTGFATALCGTAIFIRAFFVARRVAHYRARAVFFSERVPPPQGRYTGRRFAVRHATNAKTKALVGDLNALPPRSVVF